MKRFVLNEDTKEAIKAIVFLVIIGVVVAAIFGN